MASPSYQFERFGLVIVWLAVIAIFGILRPETFLTWSNFSSIFGSEAVLVIVTLGLIIPLTAGDFDLSIAQTLTFVSMLTAIMSARMGVPLGYIIPAALLAGAAIGVVNGAITLYFRVHSLIVTLGVGTFLHGITLWMSDSQTISGVTRVLMQYAIIQRIFGIPLSFYYAIILAAIALSFAYSSYVAEVYRAETGYGATRNGERLSVAPILDAPRVGGPKALIAKVAEAVRKRVFARGFEGEATADPGEGRAGARGRSHRLGRIRHRAPGHARRGGAGRAGFALRHHRARSHPPRPRVAHPALDTFGAARHAHRAHRRLSPTARAPDTPPPAPRSPARPPAWAAAAHRPRARAAGCGRWG